MMLQAKEKADLVQQESKDSKYLIAFDQATQVSGYSVWDINSKELIDWGTIKETKGAATQRINKIKKKIDELISKYNNVVTVVEDIQYQEDKERGNKITFGSPSTPTNNAVDNVKTFKTLAWLQGVLLDYFFENGIESSTMFASSWKSFCEIKGRTRATQKMQSIEFVKQHFGVTVTTDEADAICLGWTKLHK